MSSSSRVRARVAIPEISVRFSADGTESVGQLENLTRTGVFIRTAELPRPGAAVALQFRDSEGEIVDLRGQVRWNTQGLSSGDSASGFGVLLHEPPPEYLRFFDWVFRQARDDKPADVDPV
jgi:hypothetical protein